MTKINVFERYPWHIAFSRIWIPMVILTNLIGASNITKRLYDDLLKQRNYNKLIRPVSNTSDLLVIKLGMRLTSIVDVDEKNQIMATNVWLEQEWYDHHLMWNPADYNNVKRIYIPSEEIWLPDIVLYNSADGNFTVKIKTKATVHHDGLVIWKPPAIYQSLCPINVEYFPFDEQGCWLKIGSWTYDGKSIDIRHKNLGAHQGEFDEVTDGINLTDYSASAEWELMAVPARKYKKHYTCCSEPYFDIKFNMTIRRKTLFYTINLILPCIAICSATVLVFYTPAKSGEKVTMGITILNSLNIFLLLVAEINPPTSISIPLIGKYLLFTMVLVTCSIILTVFVLNIHFRSPSTHTMSPWIRELFLNILPRLLLMQRPMSKKQSATGNSAFKGAESGVELSDFGHYRRTSSSFGRRNIVVDNSYAFGGGLASEQSRLLSDSETYNDATASTGLPSTVRQAMIGVNFIAEHLKYQNEVKEAKEDWQFVAMVLDRLFLWIFTTACLVGTFGIIIQAPTLYDKKAPLG